MKTKYRKIPARFGAETRFEVEPAFNTRSRELATLETLKSELLAHHASAPENQDFRDELGHAAAEAAALAYATSFPLLFFPVLFAEKAEQARARALRQQEIRRFSAEVLLA